MTEITREDAVIVTLYYDGKYKAFLIERATLIAMMSLNRGWGI